MHREIKWLLTTQLLLSHLTCFSCSSPTLGSLRFGHFRFDAIELTNLHMYRFTFLVWYSRFNWALVFRIVKEIVISRMCNPVPSQASTSAVWPQHRCQKRDRLRESLR